MRRLKAARQRKHRHCHLGARPSCAVLITDDDAFDAASVIGPDLAIVGQKITLVCKSALVIAGEVSGDIHGDDVTVGQSGKVTGTVSARTLTIHGEINGTLRAETVALHATARINGDIVQKNLVIAEGAQFDGRVRSAKDPSDWQPVLDADAHRAADA
jgi:cytoskeletal protein CcmA (bactofilin family)